jgi:hypothetical protein
VLLSSSEHANRSFSKDGSEIRNNTLRLLARNAQDGQRISVVDPPFENVELNLDPTASYPISARFNDAPQLKYEHRLRNSQALETFRGTLVDGILQPNVRLGNGMRLSTKPEILKPQITEKRRARNHEARRLRESAHPPSEAPVKSLHQSDMPSSRKRILPTRPERSTSPLPKTPRDLDLERREAQIAKRERELIQLQQQLLLRTTHNSPGIRAEAEPDSKLAIIEARERALEQKEELLRYKRKTWLLEQKLAQATARFPSRRRFRETETDVQESDPNVPYSVEPNHEAMSESNHADSHGEQHGNYTLDNPSPPEALKNLRSRIQLPTRKMIRSGTGPRHR